MSKSKRNYDAERYAVLAAVYPKAGTSIDNSSVGAYRTKTVKAGEFLYVACYPLISLQQRQLQESELEALKREKARAIQAKYARYNNGRRLMAFEQLVHANFGKGDFHVTCTYENPGLSDIPCAESEMEYRDREQAKRDAENYIKRIKRLLKRHGCDVNEFRYIKVTVTKTHDPEARRPFPDVHHHHILMHGVPEELRGEVERLWPFGYCNADRLQPDDKGVSAMAGYVGRQENSANGDHARGEKSWSGSKNLIRPEVKTSDARISRRRAAQIAADVRANAQEIFGKIYPEYRLVEWPKVETSEFVAGGYIYAKLRRTTSDRKGGNTYGKDQSGLVRKARDLAGEV